MENLQMSTQTQNSHQITWKIDKKWNKIWNSLQKRRKIFPKTSNVPLLDVWKFAPVLQGINPLESPRCSAITLLTTHQVVHRVLLIMCDSWSWMTRFLLILSSLILSIHHFLISSFHHFNISSFQRVWRWGKRSKAWRKKTRSDARLP